MLKAGSEYVLLIINTTVQGPCRIYKIIYLNSQPRYKNNNKKIFIMIRSIVVGALIAGERVTLTIAVFRVYRFITASQLLGPQEFTVSSQDRRVSRLRLILILLLAFNFHACLTSAFSRGGVNRRGLTLLLVSLF